MGDTREGPEVRGGQRADSILGAQGTRFRDTPRNREGLVRDLLRAGLGREARGVEEPVDPQRRLINAENFVSSLVGTQESEESLRSTLRNRLDLERMLSAVGGEARRIEDDTGSPNILSRGAEGALDFLQRFDIVPGGRDQDFSDLEAILGSQINRARSQSREAERVRGRRDNPRASFVSPGDRGRDDFTDLVLSNILHRNPGLSISEAIPEARRFERELGPERQISDTQGILQEVGRRAILENLFGDLL